MQPLPKYGHEDFMGLLCSHTHYAVHAEYWGMLTHSGMLPFHCLVLSCCIIILSTINFWR